ncbi:MAG: hypothetical protein EPN70_10100 [Paraburkholderia sp.]|uniref:hypothetical protein n=1 Tax=Paraburkholderia sp. TaxID=1926495 RepID=UPI0011FCDA8D|nr:hypothetical protein [Paraburkholderia sp.]TAM04907.1 MAG: hypothetical protein EPN70_10100 [Paraburkholderia sp.]TAM29589.1 MAG: hypothetical protein EPN59_11615 [Paraburkholderia sp.]
MTDLDVDELYADVIASASPTGFIRQTLRDLVGKLKVDDVFVPHDVSLNVLRSERAALLYVAPGDGWAALLMRAKPGDRRKEMAFHWPEAGACRIGPYRLVFSIPADIDDIASELEQDGWAVVPIVPGWTARANLVPTDHGCFRGETFKHAATRCALL